VAGPVFKTGGIPLAGLSGSSILLLYRGLLGAFSEGDFALAGFFFVFFGVRGKRGSVRLDLLNFC